MEQKEFSEIVDLIRKEDARFDRQAYFFLRGALDQTVTKMRKAGLLLGRRSNHVAGPELLEGIRDYALEQYGPMALTLLRAWNIGSCGDFGEIVFNLIDYGVLSKTDEDSREDFAEIFDFDEAFAKPFRPVKRRLPDPPVLPVELS
ncbi:MAG: hypothetical protein R3F07_05115 [Opitutaceae bacterium]